MVRSFIWGNSSVAELAGTRNVLHSALDADGASLDVSNSPDDDSVAARQHLVIVIFVDHIDPASQRIGDDGHHRGVDGYAIEIDLGILEGGQVPVTVLDAVDPSKSDLVAQPVGKEQLAVAAEYGHAGLGVAGVVLEGVLNAAGGLVRDAGSVPAFERRATHETVSSGSISFTSATQGLLALTVSKFAVEYRACSEPSGLMNTKWVNVLV